MSEKTKRQKKRTFIYLWVLLALIILLVASTYTWFSLSQTPHVNDMSMYINAQSGIEIAKEFNAPDEDWGQRIDFVDIVSGDYPLRPATWSDSRQKFMAMGYGLDGRMLGFKELSDERNANKSGGDGYYVTGTMYFRTDTACNVSLAEAIEVNGGENGAGTFVIGKPEWDSKEIQHKDSGNGAETAIRIGFRITRMNKETGAAIGEPEFFIYEPNCDRHITNTVGYFATPSIDDIETLTDTNHMILQKSSSWTESEPVEHNVTIKKLGQFLQNKTLFRITPEEKVKAVIYIWLEGQDSDCVSQIDEAKIVANIQFHVDYGGQSGYEVIK